MTALFVPALSIMGEHFPECPELSQHHSSSELGKKGVQPDAELRLPSRPVCSALQMQSMGFKVSVTTCFSAVANVQVIF